MKAYLVTYLKTSKRKAVSLFKNISNFKDDLFSFIRNRPANDVMAKQIQHHCKKTNWVISSQLPENGKIRKAFQK